MEPHCPTTGAVTPDSGAGFISTHLARFRRRFRISFSADDTNTEYVIRSRRTGRRVSYAIRFLHDPDSGSLHVSKFFPGLAQRRNGRYLSAACFFLLIHHFATMRGCPRAGRITLKTEPSIFHRFYARLKDFRFQIQKDSGGRIVELSSVYTPVPIDASMIRPMRK